MAQEEVKTIKLISSDGHEFIVDRKCALVSGTIRSMMEGSFSEAEQGQINFREIATPILEKVIQYLLQSEIHKQSVQTRVSDSTGNCLGLTYGSQLLGHVNRLLPLLC